MHIPVLSTYTKWLHTQYPAGKPEPLPEVNEDGSTKVTGLYVVGDLKGIPLLKFSTDSGAAAVEKISGSSWFQSSKSKDSSLTDVVIIGAGVAGISAALRAKKLGLSYRVLEGAQCFSTIVNFPQKKPIYTYPKDFEPDTELATTADLKESLLDELFQQVEENGIEIEENTSVDRVVRRGGHMEVDVKDGDVVKARSVIVAIGRSGNYRQMGVPGEDLDKVSNRLHDPKDFCDKKVLVVGGGDSALETAIALADCGSPVTLSYRKPEFSRPKPENIDKLHNLASKDAAPGSIRLQMNTEPVRIDDTNVTIKNKNDQSEEVIDNHYVFAMIGREAPLEFFRKSKVPISGEWRPTRVLSFAAFLLFCVFVYFWKAGSGPVSDFFAQNNLFPFNLSETFASTSGWLNDALNDPSHLLGTLAISVMGPGFYYTLAYSSAVVIFGVRRIVRRKTPYITLQTITLMIIQTFPLFLLPEIFFPWAGHNGWFESGMLKSVADSLFPEVGYGHGREYWRAYGLILAWPLFMWNFFTAEPMVGWLVLGSIQTFVLIPFMIYFWGKGSYCGWICSCGALAETLGDTHRHKMPHGPFWNRLNMTGQVILWIALIGMGVQIYVWANPNSGAKTFISSWIKGDAPKQTLVYKDATVPPEDRIEWKEVTNEDGEVVTDQYGDAVWEAIVYDENGDPLPKEQYAYEYVNGDPIIGEKEWVSSDRVRWLPNDPESEDAFEVPQYTDASGQVVQGVMVAVDNQYQVQTQNTGIDGINYFSYKWLVDILLAGIIGVGFYFWYSGRVWCRFACPLAALMHVYTKFSRFRIIPDKKKCISCNVCTSVCHQGIDVMNFANKGKPMSDPECVRCSACVQSCPTGVLQFGQVDKDGNTIKLDKLQASPVLMKEEKNNQESA